MVLNCVGIEEITEVERIVNEQIRANISLDERRDVPIKEATEMGAMALFGEKYGERVRVIIFDPKYSVELCGGTHVANTGNIGMFKIVSESSIASGIRRIEAVTALEAESLFSVSYDTIAELSEFLKSKNILESVKSLVEAKNQLEKDLELKENVLRKMGMFCYKSRILT